MELFKKYFALVSVGISAIIVVIAMSIQMGADEFNEAEVAAANNKSVDILLYLTYVILVLITAGAVIFSLVTIAMGKVKSIIVIGLSVAVMVGLYFITQATASGDLSMISTSNKAELTEGEVQFAGGLLSMMMILGFLGLAGIAILEIYRIAVRFAK